MKKTALDPEKQATDGQYGELKTMFEHSARNAVSGRDEVQNLQGRWNRIGPEIEKLLKRFSYDASLVDSDLLEAIKVVQQVPAVEAFSAKEKFNIGTQDGVKIGYRDNNFKATFLAKNEIDVPVQDLRVHRLRKSSVDAPILKELGGHDLVETNLATMWEMMKLQGQGEKGDLLVDGKANIFYIRDGSNTLWAVRCRWHTDEWDVYANSVTLPNTRDADNQIFSR